MEDPVIIIQRFKCNTGTLWKALTIHDLMVKWFFNNIPEFRPEVGFKTNFTIENEGRIFPHIWKIVEVIPKVKIVYDWRYQGYEGASTVTFEIKALDEGSVLTVHHVNDQPYDQSIPEFKRDSCEAGWKYFIQNSLSKFLDDQNLTS